MIGTAKFSAAVVAKLVFIVEIGHTRMLWGQTKHSTRIRGIGYGLLSREISNIR